MKKITSLFVLLTFVFSPLSVAFAETTREQQIEQLRAEINRIKTQLSALSEAQAYEGYSLLIINAENNISLLSVGDVGQQVDDLQQFLVDKGYDSSGTVNGIYSDRTQAAVNKFRKRNSFYLQTKDLSTQDTLINGITYKFSFIDNLSTDTISSINNNKILRDVEFTREVIESTYDVDNYKQDISLVLTASDGVGSTARADIDIEGHVDMKNEKIYMVVEGEVSYDAGFFAKGFGDIKAEILLSRDGVFVKVQETDLLKIPEEYTNKWIGLEFEDIPKFDRNITEKEVEEMLNEVFAQAFNNRAQIDAYNNLPFYSIKQLTKHENRTLTNRLNEEVNTYEIHVNSESVNRAINSYDNNSGTNIYGYDVHSVAEDFSKFFKDFEIEVSLNEKNQMVETEINFSQRETVRGNTSKVDMRFVSFTQEDKASIPRAPRNYIQALEIYEETVGVPQRKAQDARSISDVKQVALHIEVNQNQYTGRYTSDLSSILPRIPQGVVFESNSRDTSNYCIWTRLGGGDVDYYAASREGSGYMKRKPSLSSCDDFFIPRSVLPEKGTWSYEVAVISAVKQAALAYALDVDQSTGFYSKNPNDLSRYLQGKDDFVIFEDNSRNRESFCVWNEVNSNSGRYYAASEKGSEHTNTRPKIGRCLSEIYF